MTQGRLRSLLRYVGPWPIRPVMEFFVILLVSLLISSGTLIATRGESYVRALLVALAPAFAAAFVVGGLLWLAKRLLGGILSRSLAAYLLVIAVISFAGLVARAAATRLPVVHSPDDLALIPFGTFRYWAWITASLALTGYVVERLSRQTLIAQEALREAREQQELMLISEERSRRQIAVLLHDKVQAGLITACLELQLVHGRDPQIDDVRIGAVIHRLETLRGLDVRSAARALSPDLSTVDFHSALQDLAQLYEPGLRTRLEIDPRITSPEQPIPSDVRLALYRLAEQGLLNAAVHGGASECSLDIRMAGSTSVILELTDNGRGFGPDPISPGFGEAVITTWTRLLGGSWAWGDAPAGGGRLSASFPVAREATAVVIDEST